MKGKKVPTRSSFDEMDFIGRRALRPRFHFGILISEIRFSISGAQPFNAQLKAARYELLNLTDVNLT